MSEEEIVEHLQERLQDARGHGLQYQLEYESTVAHLARIRLHKAVDYGERRYDPALSAEFNRWMCYSDVYRKFIRLESQMARADIQGLEETYSDLANYAIMALQLIRRKK